MNQSVSYEIENKVLIYKNIKIYIYICEIIMQAASESVDFTYC